MSADFWAGYISGAVGIVIGNPLDVLKVRLQAFGKSARNSSITPSSLASQISFSGSSAGSEGERGNPRQPIRNWLRVGELTRGIAPPILTYGPLNALLFVSYNRTLSFIDSTISDPANPPSTTLLSSIWLAGAVGGFATWIVSAPTESVKCRAQVTGSSRGSLAIARELWQRGGGGCGGIRQLYTGGGITSIRDAVGYGFYFWSYELCKRMWPVNEENSREQALRVLICGGIAGVVTWTSIFPLDVIKTRHQIQDLANKGPEERSLLGDNRITHSYARKGALTIAQEAYRQEGIFVFFRGLGVCSARAFVVNAVQWTVYERVLQALR